MLKELSKLMTGLLVLHGYPVAPARASEVHAASRARRVRTLRRPLQQGTRLLHGAGG